MSKLVNVPEGGDVLTLGAAARACPPVDGRTPAPSTIWRWATKGLDGVRLRHWRIGRRCVTSRAALEEFFATLAEARVERLTAEASEPVSERQVMKSAPRRALRRERTPEQRRRDLEAARARLRAAGVNG